MEYVVLVDKKGNDIGLAPKNKVHTSKTPLHRGFSLFIFNSQKELLVTQRALSKKTFPGVWTNTVCGHPKRGEKPEDAAKRRLKDELGISASKIKVVSPYSYTFQDKNGIVENEICPILIGFSNQSPAPNPDEIENWKYVAWKEFTKDMKIHPEIYSPWSKEEAVILEKFISGL